MNKPKRRKGKRPEDASGQTAPAACAPGPLILAILDRFHHGPAEVLRFDDLGYVIWRGQQIPFCEFESTIAALEGGRPTVLVSQAAFDDPLCAEVMKLLRKYQIEPIVLAANENEISAALHMAQRFLAEYRAVAQRETRDRTEEGRLDTVPRLIANLRKDDKSVSVFFFNKVFHHGKLKAQRDRLNRPITQAFPEDVAEPSPQKIEPFVADVFKAWLQHEGLTGSNRPLWARKLLDGLTWEQLRAQEEQSIRKLRRQLCDELRDLSERYAEFEAFFAKETEALRRYLLDDE